MADLFRSVVSVSSPFSDIPRRVVLFFPFFTLRDFYFWVVAESLGFSVPQGCVVLLCSLVMGGQEGRGRGAMGSVGVPWCCFLCCNAIGLPSVLIVLFVRNFSFLFRFELRLHPPSCFPNTGWPFFFGRFVLCGRLVVRSRQNLVLVFSLNKSSGKPTVILTIVLPPYFLTVAFRVDGLEERGLEKSCSAVQLRRGRGEL